MSASVELLVKAEGLAQIVDELSDLSGLGVVCHGLYLRVYSHDFREKGHGRQYRVFLDKHQRRALEARLARVTLADHFGGRAL